MSRESESQNAGILDYMMTVGPITQMIALREFDCMRLPARIDDIKKSLKDTGYVVRDDWVKYTNYKGKKKRHKKYWVEVAS